MCLGIPGKITEVYETNGLRMGKVDFGGVTREACLDYVPEAGIGDYTIIDFRLGEHVYKVRLTTEAKPHPGDNIWITIPPHTTHLFDVQTGIRLI